MNHSSTRPSDTFSVGQQVDCDDQFRRRSDADDYIAFLDDKVILLRFR